VCVKWHGGLVVHKVTEGFANWADHSNTKGRPERTHLLRGHLYP